MAATMSALSPRRSCTLGSASAAMRRCTTACRRLHVSVSDGVAQEGMVRASIRVRARVRVRVRVRVRARARARARARVLG